jgi:hypothetical protein
MSSKLIALLAEDDTDCQAVRTIIHRVLGTNIKIKPWASKSCSTLKRKLSAKIRAMSREGCDTFIIVHDLDRNPLNNSLNNETKLRADLELNCSSIPNTQKHICIPIEELEAWFWSDPEVVKYIGRGKGRASSNPHLIAKPKEELIKLSIGDNRKPRYSTNMNVELAGMLNLELCSDRCSSLKKLIDFLKTPEKSS